MSGRMDIREDTIAAISTPNAAGGIGIVRLSGEDAVRIAGESAEVSLQKGRDLVHVEIDRRDILFAYIGKGLKDLIQLPAHLFRLSVHYTCSLLSAFRTCPGIVPAEVLKKVPMKSFMGVLKKAPIKILI